jgi:L-malate glycosyltransferase
MTHILFLVSWYPNPSQPFAGVFFQEQALMMKQAGYQVGILGYEFKSLSGLKKIRRPIDLLPRLSITEENGLPVYRASLWGWSLPSLMIGGQAEAFGWKAFERYCQQNGKPDLIHAQTSLYGGYLAARIHNRTGIPMVLTEHYSAFLRGTVKAHYQGLARYAFHQASAVLAVSKPLADALQPYLPPGKEARVVFNPVDTNFFTPISQSNRKEFNFTVICSLNPNKGIDILLQAFATAFIHQKVILNIGGAGPEKDRLIKLTHDLGIERQVNFLGPLSREQVREQMQSSHLVVSSSYFETFGITLIEAMACGKPVIATRSGGPETFVTEKNGLLVEPGNVESMAQAMLELRQRYADYSPEQIRADCVARFSSPVFVNTMTKIYTDLLGRA